MMEYLKALKGKDVLVTGGLGFIGRNLVEELTTSYNCRVIIVDDESNASGYGFRFFTNPDKIKFNKVSVLDYDKLFSFLPDVDYIFHLACVQIAASSSDPIHDLRVNAESTLRLLDHIKRNKLPRLQRFIYASSCSVYGNAVNNFPAREEGGAAPLSHYAASKLLGENYTRIYYSQYGLPTSVVRYSNVYGYWQTPKNPYCGVMGKFVHNALTNNPCAIIGDGEQTRDYTFITDSIRATLLAATHPKAVGELFNVGTGKETTVNQLVEIIKLLKPDIEIEYLPERDIDNIRRRVIDSEFIHAKLGWAPQVDIKRGLEETFNWYKKNLAL